MPSHRTLILFVALAGCAFADAYTDFNAAIATFNLDVTSWNSGPLGLVAFNVDIANFNTAVGSFNAATSGSYATVSSVSPYGTVSPYPGSTPSITTFNAAVTTFDSVVGSFDAGSLDQPDFASNVTTFNSAAANFNVAGASPPVAFEPLPPTYSQEQLVTNPGTSTPELSSAWLVTLGLGGALCLAKTRLGLGRPN